MLRTDFQESGYVKNAERAQYKALLCRGPHSKSSGLCGYTALAARPQGRRLSVKAATEGTQTHGRTGSQYSFTHGCFEFHIIFMGHIVLSFFRFVLNHLKM